MPLNEWSYVVEPADGSGSAKMVHRAEIKVCPLPTSPSRGGHFIPHDHVTSNQTPADFEGSDHFAINQTPMGQRMNARS